MTALAAVAAACSPGEEAGPGVEQTAPVAADTSTEVVVTEEPIIVPEPGDPVPALLASMTVDDKIGQLLMPMIHGTASEASADDRALNLAAHGFATAEEIVANHRLGGVVYLGNNITSADQLRAFSRDLQAASDAATGIGLLLAVDQEGGTVNRMTDEVSVFPAASEFTGDPGRAREAAFVTGQQVQQQGVNVVLAPVADVQEPGDPGFIGDRSFGDDPQEVASMVAAAVSGLQDAGVAAAVKHWPGHGATRVDSHERLPTVDVERAQWDQRERVPFDAAIAADVAIVMVGHLALPNLDPAAVPATVSPVLVDGLLRQELGFDGVVMTDALNMGAVSAYGDDELAVAAVLAGVDVILVPPSLTAAVAGLQAAVADGRITEERLDAAVARVLRLKHDLGLLPAPAGGAAAEG